MTCFLARHCHGPALSRCCARRQCGPGLPGLPLRRAHIFMPHLAAIHAQWLLWVATSSVLSSLLASLACDSVCTSTSVVSASASWDADSSTRLESHSVDSASVCDATSNSCAARMPAPSAALACPHAASSLQHPADAHASILAGWTHGGVDITMSDAQKLEIRGMWSEVKVR
jgi:hypothetical protein